MDLGILLGGNRALQAEVKTGCTNTPFPTQRQLLDLSPLKGGAQWKMDAGQLTNSSAFRRRRMHLRSQTVSSIQNWPFPSAAIVSILGDIAMSQVRSQHNCPTVTSILECNLNLDTPAVWWKRHAELFVRSIVLQCV
eukprot:4357601-Amphidinium_carterae.1